MNCKRFGKEKARINEEYRHRHRYTVKCECLFSVKIREQTDSSWIVQHREGQQYCIHNHEPAPPGTFPEHRQLTRDQTALIETNYASGIPASRTIAVLRPPSIFTTPLPTSRVSRAKRQRKSPPEALIDGLETEKAEGKTHFEWQRDAEGHIAMLFIADVRSVAYLNRHPDILLLDCTYKTNKFDMPLLHVLGIDHHGNSFTIALSFLDQEVAENYAEAVKYLRGLYNPGN